MKCLKVSLLAAAIGLVSSGFASATSITTPGLSVVSGPLTFSDFTCDFTTLGPHANGTCASISVTPLTPPPAGIQLSGPLSVLGISSADAALGFKVTSTSAVSSVGLTFTSVFLGMDVNSVVENVYDGSVSGALLGTATVTGCGALAGCPTTLSDTIALSSASTNLFITKDIQLAGFASGDFGSLSIIDQTFTSALSTPEPVTVSLIGAGLAMFGLVRIRKNRNRL
jgi:hypothetical protein